MSEDNTPTPKKKFQPFTITDEELKALDEEHGDVLKLHGSEAAPWMVVLRRPTRQEIIGYKHGIKKESFAANEDLIKRICVFPTKDDFAAQLARWPIFVDGIADSRDFKEFIGFTVDADLK